ncbi:MAG: class I SAM-dependent methyltransferase [Acidobacteriota bacterium]
MAVYGPAFTLVYERHWSSFARAAGPAIAKLLHAVGIVEGRVVDLGCGTGHVASALCRRRYDVIGIDASRSVLALARKRAPAARFFASRIEGAPIPRGAAAVLSTFDTLNYVLSPRDLLALFRRARAALRPGGVLLFDVNSTVALARRAGKVEVRRLPRLFLVLEGSYDPATRLGPLKLTGFVREGNLHRQFEEVHVQRAYDPDEVEELLSKAGFRHERLGGYAESPDVKGDLRAFYLARPA